jgi:predicted permease
VLAAHFGNTAANSRQLLLALIQNPTFWSFWLALGLRSLPLPLLIEQGFTAFAWAMVVLSLLLMGMRLSQLHFWQNLPQAAVSLSIKMLLVPLLIGFSLTQLGLTGLPRLAIVLQTAMPPAFATLVIAEAYNLDRELTVTLLALGSLLLLLFLPLWLMLFGV